MTSACKPVPVHARVFSGSWVRDMDGEIFQIQTFNPVGKMARLVSDHYGVRDRLVCFASLDLYYTVEVV